MSEQDKPEAVPEGEAFHGCVSWTLLEMQHARDFEGLIDYRLARLKEQIMQTYRDRRPAPFPELSTDEEGAG